MYIGDESDGEVGLPTMDTYTQVLLNITTNRKIKEANVYVLTPGPGSGLVPPDTYAVDRFSDELALPVGSQCHIYDYDKPTQPAADVISCTVVSLGGEKALRIDVQMSNINYHGPQLLYILARGVDTWLVVSEMFYSSHNVPPDLLQLDRSQLTEQVFRVPEQMVHTILFY